MATKETVSLVLMMFVSIYLHLQKMICEVMAKSNESSKDKEIKEVVLGVFMHCEGCKNQVSKCLRGFQGVEEVIADSENQKVVITGRDLDPAMILERVKNKFSKKAVLISPKVLREEKEKEKKPAKKPEAEVKTVELKMLMHCDGCVNDVKELAQRMAGVMSVEANKESSRVVVRGVMEAQKLAEEIEKRMRKKVEIVKEEVEKKKKEEAKGSEKKTQKKEEPVAVIHYLPPCSFHHFYPNQTFGDDDPFSCAVM